MRKIDECGMEKFGTLQYIASSEKTIDILKDRRWPQTAKQEADNVSKMSLYHIRKKKLMSAQMFEVSLLGVGTVRLERDEWSMVKMLRQVVNLYPAQGE